MARNYARIGTTIWDDPDFLALTPGAQRCYLFLLSQRDLPLTGVLVRRSRWLRSAAGFDTLDDDLAELDDRGFVLVDDDTDEVLIRTFMRHDGVLANPKLRKGARARVDAIHSPRLRAVVEQQLNEAEGVSDDSSDDLCGALSDDPCDRAPDSPEALSPESFDPGASSLVSEIHPPPVLSDEEEEMFERAAVRIASWELDDARARGVAIHHPGGFRTAAYERAKTEHRAKAAETFAGFVVTDDLMLARVLVGKQTLRLHDRREAS